MKQIVWLYVMLVALILSGCATLNPAPAGETPKPAEHITVNLPKWPGLYAYQSQDPSVIIIMAVKNPGDFPVPPRFVFKNPKDNTEFAVPLLVPEKPKEEAAKEAPQSKPQ